MNSRKGNQSDVMPYKTLKDLPDSVQEHLPKHAQEIYLEAFNNAWKQYKDPEKRRAGSSHEVTAHRVAWAAVKREYRKDPISEKWVKI
jgi:cation transport regulator